MLAALARFVRTSWLIGRGRRRLTVRKWVTWPNVARNLTVLQLEDRVTPAIITWANAAGGDWNTGANWVGGVTPSAADDAVIPDLPGTPVIQFSADTSIHSVVSAERIFFDGGRNWTIAATSALNAGINLSAGSNVIVTGGVLTLAGTSSWADGTFTGAGSVLHTGNMFLTAGSHGVGTTFQNAGTVQQSAGVLYLGSATSAFVNLPAGTHTLTGSVANDTPIYLNDPNAKYTNQGAILRQFGSSNLIISGQFVNQGIVNTQAGSLDIRGSATHTGTFATAPGASLLFSNGTATLAAGAALTGAGAVTLSGGSFAVAADVSASNLTVAGGSITTAAGKTLTLTGTTGAWKGGGPLAGAGSFAVAPGATFTLDPNGAGLSLGTILTNAGTINFVSNGTINIAAGQILSNTGLFDFQNVSGTVFNGGTLANSGTLRRSVGAGNVYVVSPVANSGTVDVQAGSMTWAGGAALTGGTYNASAGTSLVMAGNASWSGTLTGSGAGFVSQQSGTVTVAAGGATLNFPGDGYLRWTTGVVTGGNTLTVAATGRLTLDPAGQVVTFNTPVTNLGTIRHVSPGRLDLGASGSLLNAGTLSIETIGQVANNTGTLTNTGLLTVAAGGGSAFFSGPLSSTGTVEVTAGTLTLAGTVAQLTGPTFARTLAAGTWRAAGGALDFPGGNSVRTIGSGAAVTLDGAGSGVGGLLAQYIDGSFAVRGGATFGGGGNGLQVSAGGTVSVGTGSSLTTYASVDNAGTVVVAGDFPVSAFQQTAGLTRLDGGSLASSNFYATGGTLAGTGTLASVFLTSATLAPGASPGILTITGDLTLGSSSVTQIEVQGTNPTTPDYDQVRVSGTVTLGGTLVVTYLNGFVLDRSENINVIQAPLGPIGDFTTTSFPTLGGVPLATGFPDANVYVLRGTTYAVRTTADSGPFSLRDQIATANAAAGADLLLFNIPGGGVQTIQPLSALPAITDPLTLDATSQPGYAGTPLVELDGTSAGAGTDGLTLAVGAAGSVVRGLAIGNFKAAGVRAGAASVVLTANRIGTNAAGTARRPNDIGVEVQANGVRVGTDGDGVNDAAEGNLISGNTSFQVSFDGATGGRLSGNLIGPNAAGTASLSPTGDGVATFSSSGVVIGTDGSNDSFNANERNIISGIFDRGVILEGPNVVAGNWIGLASDGVTPLPNQFGVQVTETGGRVGTNSDGVADAAERNLISGNTLDGVAVRNGTTTGAVLAGNWIGLTAAGTAAGNGRSGVSVVNGAHDNTIGGTNVAQTQTFNLGATPGVVLVQFAGILTTPLAYLPTAAQMEAALNALSSIGGVGGTVSVDQAGASYTVTFGGSLAYLNNPLLLVTVGGVGRPVSVSTSPRFAGNVVSGNTGSGVRLIDTGTSGNKLSGNYIGTDSTGTAARPNNVGVRVLSGASGSLVGNSSPGGRNVISGNTTQGVEVVGAAGTVIRGNWIGLNSAGTGQLGNVSDGVLVSTGATGTVIGGLTGFPAAPAPGTGQGNVISGNGTAVFLYAPATIQGNVIGLAADGVTRLGPAATAGAGIVSDVGGDNVLVGGTSVQYRNVISGNAYAFYLGAQSGWQLLNNYVGTDVSGTLERTNAVGSYFYGTQNLTWGQAGAGNLWVTSGYYNTFSYGDHWTVRGNRFQVTADGSAPLGTVSGSGLYISRGSDLKFGGTGAGDGNQFGTSLQLEGVAGGSFLGNTLGLTAAGTAVLPGVQYGLSLGRGVSGFQVGDGTAAGRNVFALDTGGVYAVSVSGGTTTGNSVRGNWIGTNTAGTAGLGVSVYGVQVAGSAANTTVSDNVIARFGSYGVDVDGTGTPDFTPAWFRFNDVLLTNSSGYGFGGKAVGVIGYGPGRGTTQALSLSRATPGYVVSDDTNGFYTLSAADVSVYGWVNPTTLPANGERYLIAANGDVSALDPNYQLSLFRDVGGVLGLALRYHTTTGSQVASVNIAAAQVPAGTFTHVAVTAGGGSVKFYLNGTLVGTVAVVGTPAAQYAAVTGDPGELLYIGGGPNAANLTFAGRLDDVALTWRALSPAEVAHIAAAGPDSLGGSWTRNTTVTGNLIGLLPDGTTTGGGGTGVVIQDAANSTVGGTTAAARNVIAGMRFNGVTVTGSQATGNTVLGNYIGVDRTGAAAGNAAVGVQVDGGATGTTVGGTAAGAGNLIAFNTKAGVLVLGSGSTGNPVRGNSIFSNGGPGIDLGGDGVTANDLAGHAGPNSFQNFPVLTFAGGGAATSPRGLLIAAPNTAYALDFYAGPATDPSGYGEGQRYLGSASVTTDAAGRYAFTLTLPADTSVNDWVSATATDPAGNTSEFARSILADVPPTVSLSVQTQTLVGVNQPVVATLTDSVPGKTYQFAWTATFNGGLVSLTDPTVVAPTAVDQETLFFTPRRVGTYQLTLTVTDSRGGVTVASSGSITVAGTSLGVTITGATTATPAPFAVTAGQSVTLTSTLADPRLPAVGPKSVLVTPTYTYVWSLVLVRNGQQVTVPLPAGTAAGPTLTFTPTAGGQYLASLAVTDGTLAAGADSVSLNATAGPVAQIVATPGTAVTADTFVSLQAVLLDAGLRPGLNYSWTVTRPDGTTLSNPPNAASYGFPTPVPGNYIVALTVVDGQGRTGTATPVRVRVSAATPVVTVSGPTATAPGGAVTLTGTVTDGGSTNSYTLSWSALSSAGTVSPATGSSSSFTFTPSAAGAVAVTLKATDQNKLVTLTEWVVNVAPPAASVVVTGPATGVAGQPLVWTAALSPADPTATYLWTVFGPDGVTTATNTGTTKSLSLPYAKPGRYDVSLIATTAGGFRYTAGPPQPGTSVTVAAPAVTAGIAVSAPPAPRISFQEGDAVTLTSTSTVTGADPSDLTRFGYLWAVTGPKGFYQTGVLPKLGFTPPAAGIYTATLLVRDYRTGQSGTVTTTVTVGHAAPQPFLRYTGVNPDGTLGVQVMVANPGGKYTYTVQLGSNTPPQTIAGGSVYGFSVPPPTVPTFLSVTVTDSAGATGTLTATLQPVGAGPRTVTAADLLPGTSTVVVLGLGNSVVTAGSGLPDGTTVEFLAIGANNTFTGSPKSTVASIFYGDSGSNALYGGAGPNTFYASGNDTVQGGGGSNLVVPVPVGPTAGTTLNLTAGTGTNTLDLSRQSGVTLDLTATAAQVFAGTQQVKLAGQFQTVVGSGGSDTLTAASGESVSGGGGNDLLQTAGASNVTLSAASGQATLKSVGGANVLLAGGSGSNSSLVALGGVNVSLVGGSGANTSLAAGGGASGVTLVGGSGANASLTAAGGANGVLLVGGSGSNSSLMAGAANVTLVGGLGSTPSLIAGASNVSLVGGSGANASLLAGAGATGVQLFGGSGANSSLVAVGGSVTLVGGSGSNPSLLAGPANVTLVGGSGANSSLMATSGASNVSLVGGSGSNASLVAAGGTVTLAGGSGTTASLLAGVANVTLVGGSGANASLVAGGGASNVTLVGGSGGNASLLADAGSTGVSMVGGSGDNASLLALGASVTLVGGSGANNSLLSGGGATAVSIVGGSGANASLVALGAGVILVGGSGSNASLVAGPGSTNVSLVGGSGANTSLLAAGGSTGVILVGGSGSNASLVAGTSTTVTLTGGSGSSPSVLTGTGTTAVTLVGGSGNNASLYAGAGATAVQLIGGSGANASLVAGPGASQVTLAGGSGANATFLALGAGVQLIGGSGSNASLVAGGGAVNVAATGGSGANASLLALGGSTNVSLVGGSGANDSLVAMGGSTNVSLVGGSGVGAVLLAVGPALVPAGGSGSSSSLVAGASNVTLVGGSGANASLLADAGATGVVMVGGSGSNQSLVAGTGAFSTSLLGGSGAGASLVAGTGVSNVTLVGGSGANASLVAGDKSLNVSIVGGSGANATLLAGASSINVQLVGGSGANDSLVAQTGCSNVSLLGGSGDNLRLGVTSATGALLIGGLGNNLRLSADGTSSQVVLIGGFGANDTLTTGAGVTSAQLVGGFGDNASLAATGGSGLLLVGGFGKGNKLSTAGTSNATLVAGSGDFARLTRDGGSNVFLYGQSGNGDSLLSSGGGANVSLIGGSGSNLYLSDTGSSNVSLFGGTGSFDTVLSDRGTGATVYGGNGDHDSVVASNGTRVLAVGGTGRSLSVSGFGLTNATLYGGSGDLNTVSTSGGTNVLAVGGTGQANQLFDFSGTNDILANGGNGFASLSSSGGSGVRLFGGGGTDFLSAVGGTNIGLYGEGGDNTYSLAGPFTGYLDQLGTDGFEQSAADRVTGGMNVILFPGADRVSLDLSLSVGGAAASAAVSAATQQVTGNVSLYLVGLFNGAVGSAAGADLIRGNALPASLVAGGGNATLVAGSGGGTLVAGSGSTALVGGSGPTTYALRGPGAVSVTQLGATNQDVIDLSGLSGPASLNLGSAAPQAVVAGLSVTLATPTIPDVLGSPAGNTLTGNARDNHFTLGGGTNTVAAGTGLTTLKFVGPAVGSDMVSGATPGSVVLNFHSLGQSVKLDLSQASQPVGGGTLTFAGSASVGAVASAVGTVFDDTLTAGAAPVALFGGGGRDSLVAGGGAGTPTATATAPNLVMDGPGGGDYLAAGTRQVVLFDFDTYTPLSPGNHIYTQPERDAIVQRVQAVYAQFSAAVTDPTTGQGYANGFVFTQSLAAARALTRATGGEFVTLYVNKPPVGGQADQVDFGNADLGGSASVDASRILGAPGQPDPTTANFIAETAGLAEHELAHLAGLRHTDSFGPVGSGAYQVFVGGRQVAGPDPTSSYPVYAQPAGVTPVTVTAAAPALADTSIPVGAAAYGYETPLHVMGSPASVGTTRFDTLNSLYFGEREATRLAFDLSGETILAQAAAHGSVAAAQSLGTLPGLSVPNTLGAGALNAGKSFGVTALAVRGTIGLDLTNGRSRPDWYSFTGRGGDWMSFETISNVLPNNKLPLDTILRVYDSAGRLLAWNDDEPESKDSLIQDLLLPADGRYFVQVDTYAADPAANTSQGNYTLYLTGFHIGPSLGGGSTLVAGNGTDTVVGGSGTDLMRVPAEATGRLLAVAGTRPGVLDASAAPGATVRTLTPATATPLAVVTASLPQLAFPSALTSPVQIGKGGLVQVNAAVANAGGRAVSYSLAAISGGQIPAGMSIRASDGTVTWTAGGQGAYQVTVIATASDGSSASAVLTFNVSAVAPALVPVAAPSATVGAPVTLTGGVANPVPADGYSYAWSVTRNGVPYPLPAGTTSAPTLTFTPGLPGSYTATLTVTDLADQAAGLATAAATTATTLTVADVAPVVAPLPAQATTAGGPVSFAAVTSYPGTAGSLTNTWVVKNSANAIVTTGTGATFSFVPPDSGTFTVTLSTATAGSPALVTSTSTTVTAAGVAPTATPPAAVSVSRGTAATLTITSPTSSLATPGFRYSFALTQAGLATAVAGTSPSYTFAATQAAGVYMVYARVFDKNGLSTDYSTAVTVTPVQLVITPAGPLTAGKSSAATLTVATFTDPAGADAPSAYTATINWGDGSSSAGTLTLAAGTFSVAGAHTYATQGGYPVTVSVGHDAVLPAAKATTRVTVTAPKLVGTGSPTLAATTAADTGSLTLATFTDPTGPDALSTYAALVAWGDGTTSAGTVTLSGGTFTVAAGHAYTSPGVRMVTVTLRHQGSPDATVTDSLTVTNPALVATAAGLAATRSTALASVPVATFTDPAGPDALTAYTASISWGDGSSSAGTVSLNPDGQTFSVQGSHTYTAQGTFVLGVTVAHGAAPPAPTTVTASAAVANPAVVASPVAVLATAGAALSGVPVATFTDPSGADVASAYTAGISWGDGTTSAGLVSLGTDGKTFTVKGNRSAYAAGSYPVAVIVTHGGSLPAVASGTATVANPAVVAVANPLAAVRNAVAGWAVTFTDPAGPDALSRYSATFTWGDGGTSAGTITLAGTTFTVSGNHTYTAAGSNIPVSVSITHSSATAGVAAVTTVASSTANVTNPAVSALAVGPLGGVASVALTNVAVATFTDPGISDPASGYSATVTWGDGTASSTGTVSGPVSGVYTVTGGHTYTMSGSFPVSVSVTHAPSNAATASGTAAISSSKVSLTGGLTPSFAGAVSGTAKLATFTDPGGAGAVGSYTASLAWGDGTTSAGAISLGTDGKTFSVAGTHTYFTLGTETVTVTVTRSGGQAAAATSTATVGTSIFALNPTLAGSVSLVGWPSINIGGSLVVDSNSPFALVSLGAATVSTGSTRIVGNYLSLGTTNFTPAPTTGAAAVPDPLAALPVPANPGGTAQSVVVSGNQTVTLNPGLYSQIVVSGSARVTLNPGVYVIAGGSLTLAGSPTLVGSGVLIYLAGSGYPGTGGSYGGLALGGTPTVNLTPMATGTYAGVTLFQARDNNRAISLVGAALAGLNGFVYAPAALVSLVGWNGTVRTGFIVDRLNTVGGGSSGLTAAGSAFSDGSTAGELLSNSLYVYVNDPQGRFTPAERARIDDAVAAVDAVVEPYQVSVTEVTDPSLATLTLDMADTTILGGQPDGVLGVYDPDHAEVTLVSGWDWYAGTGTPAAGQYDFQTVVTHELGHALGLGHRPVSASVMFHSLAGAEVKHTLTVDDLNVGDTDNTPGALRAAEFESHQEAVPVAPARPEVAAPAVVKAASVAVSAAVAFPADHPAGVSNVPEVLPQFPTTLAAPVADAPRPTRDDPRPQVLVVAGARPPVTELPVAAPTLAVVAAPVPVEPPPAEQPLDLLPDAAFGNSPVLLNHPVDAAPVAAEAVEGGDWSDVVLLGALVGWAASARPAGRAATALRTRRDEAVG